MTRVRDQIIRMTPGPTDRSVVTNRERFTQILSAMPLIRGDVVVVLSGDGVARLPVAVEVMRQGGAPLVLVTGGLSNPPHSLPASELAGRLMGLGVPHDRILIDDASQNTHEQAQAVVAMARRRKWTRILLAASSYHLPRAYLTFLQALIAVKKDATIHLVACPATNAPWFACPDGLTVTRAQLIDEEAAKVTEYARHVATYAQGLEYLRFWEQGPAATVPKAAKRRAS